MPDFADFLDAKFDLDERSLAVDVRRECFDAIVQRDRLRCLDIGSGTGAMPLRLLDVCTGVRSIDIVALDRDERLLVRARRKLAAHLARCGSDRLDDGNDEDRLEARDAHRRIGLHFRRCDVARFEPGAGERYDIVTAHAFMDLVPMRPLLARIADWLAPGGLFYATLNYDGETTLFPTYADEAFEAALLRRYDQSMEERRVDGQPTGGAWSGRRLHAQLPEAGFDVLAWGSSDWNLVPRHGQLRGSDAVVLAVLLGALKRENDAHCDAHRLDTWHRDRCLQLGAGRLGAIVHQIDVLAVRAPTPPTIAGREASGLTAFT